MFFEVSGGVILENVRAIVEIGVECILIGVFIYLVLVVDIFMEIGLDDFWGVF